jgi:hypothetical protein
MLNKLGTLLTAIILAASMAEVGPPQLAHIIIP